MDEDQKDAIRAIQTDAEGILVVLRREKARSVSTATEIAIDMTIRATEHIIWRCKALLKDAAHNGVTH